MRRALALIFVCWLMTACGPVYTGAARDLSPDALRGGERGWLAVDRVPELRQQGQFDCGPTALSMVLSYWFPAKAHERWVPTGPERRLSAGELRDRARSTGLASFVLTGTFKDIEHELARGRPVIAGVAKPTASGAVAHYEVIVGLNLESERIATLDPAAGLRQNTLLGFLKEWQPTGRLLLVVLPREPGALARYRGRAATVLAASSRRATLAF